MYSVNIDKLMDIDSEKKESLVQIAHNITEALSSGKSVAVIGGKVDTFRIAYSIMEAGNKVLFVDGDITSDVFLGKYKLGKNARGVMDYLKNPDEDYELVCVTNHKELDIIFYLMSLLKCHSLRHRNTVWNKYFLCKLLTH